MIKHMMKIAVVAAVAVSAAGCATTSEKKMGNLTIRRYVEDRPRVDQELTGNAGYIYGTPRVEDKDRKETRRLYYVEFSQQNPEDKVVIEEKDYALPEPKVREPHQRDRSAVEAAPVTAKASKSKPAYYSYSEPAPDEAYASRSSDSLQTSSRSAVSASSASVLSDVKLPQQYKIQENDTLQKISQKFYGSYGKWTKIYDANKETLKDPDHIIPGKTITIPAL